MNAYIPKSFVETNQDAFESLLGSFNWTRESFQNGEHYNSNGAFIAVRTADSRFFVNKKMMKPIENVRA